MNPLTLIIALLILGMLFTFSLSPSLAQPCENNGHSILGKGKQIFKQSNRCVIVENNNVPTSSICGTNSVLQNGICVPLTCPIGSILQNGVCIPSTNSAPIADAGPDQTVPGNTTVTLDGSGSHATTPGATITSYSWAQIAGPPFFILPGTNTATPTFQFHVPFVVRSVDLIFSLTVTDSLGQVSQPSSVTVTVVAS